MNYQDIIIGKTVLYFLKEKKVSKTHLANSLNISNGMLTNILQGKNKLSLSRFLEVCKILKVSPVVFLNRMAKAKETINIGISV